LCKGLNRLHAEKNNILIGCLSFVGDLIRENSLERAKPTSDRIKLAGSDWTKLGILLTILLALSIVFYRQAFVSMISAVAARHGSSHGIFVPFISAYLIWQNLENIKSAAFRPAHALGLVIAAAGLVLLLAGQPESSYKLDALSFFILSAGLVLLFLGREIFRHVAFPLLFLTTMIPLPESVYIQLADLMRAMTTWGSGGLLKLIGVAHFREGFDFHFQNQHLYVAHGCSGIRYLLSYLVFGTAYAFRFKTNGVARLATVAVAIPLAIVGGILRLFIIFVSVSYVGPLFAEGRPHVLLSWSVFSAVLILAITVDQLYSKKRSKIKTARIE
jgi:exosortase